MDIKTAYSRHLRRNMTDAELALWAMLRCDRLGVRFRRQHVITPYIIDFYCPEKKIAVEVDGGQHNDNPKDEQRDIFLKSQGIQVLRFWNNDVLRNMEGVLQTISLSLNPSPRGEREMIQWSGVQNDQ